MRAASLTSRLKRCVTVRDWPWWQLPPAIRWYSAAVPVAALVVIGFAAAHTEWRVTDLERFLLLVCCGMISAASTPRVAYTSGGGVTRDFSTIWVLPVAILLPPVYPALAAIPFVAIMQLLVHRGVVYRRVFTAASIGMCYALASLVFRWFPASFAGHSVGSGLHAFTWAVAVAACEVIAGRTQHFMIVGAVKLSDHKARIWEMERNREALQGLFVEIDLVVLITLAVALSPLLVVLALPTMLLVRRFLVHPLLVAQSRVDAKTRLLNVSTWEREAEAELYRSIRTQSPLALALVDIDHFKAVNDTHGHLVGDKVLKAVADALTGHLRAYDRAGRFGGEEFVLLLSQTSETDACRIADRLRSHVAAMAVPVDDSPDSPTVRLTISIGVTAMERGESRELTDLLAAADSALYRAKQGGRNRIAVHAAESNMGLDAELDGHRVGEVQVDPAGASLRLVRLLYVSIRARHEFRAIFQWPRDISIANAHRAVCIRTPTGSSGPGPGRRAVRDAPAASRLPVPASASPIASLARRSASIAPAKLPDCTSSCLKAR
jgi:diguanylate cyclase (GGDEF)-like protein